MQSARLLPFDPIVLVQDVLKRWLVVVLAALAVGIGTYIYTDATYAPVYRTTTTFVVTTRGQLHVGVFQSVLHQQSCGTVYRTAEQLYHAQDHHAGDGHFLF